MTGRASQERYLIERTLGRGGSLSSRCSLPAFSHVVATAIGE
jgi:hypothetical protein